jgi:hypothetical protein
MSLMEPFAMQYGLQSAFSEIERLNHEVTSAGNPISIDMKTRYKVKGVGMEQTISSIVNIFYNDQGKITKVEDKWNGKLPESSIVNVSFFEFFRPMWWMFYAWGWLFWLWSLVWWTRPWLVRSASRFPSALCLDCLGYGRLLIRVTCRLSATSTRSQYPRLSACPRTRRRTVREETKTTVTRHF